MPCDTVSSARIKLNAKTVDESLLTAVMEDLGIGNWTFDGEGQLLIRGSRGMQSDAVITEQINRRYAEAVVRSQARRFGWTVKQNEDGTLEVSKAAVAMGKKF